MESCISIILLVNLIVIIASDDVIHVPKVTMLDLREELINRSRSVSSRIIGGYEALDGQFPYQAGLFLSDGTPEGLYLCGGSLIGKRWVLTAAHCLDGLVSADVYLGTHNIVASNEIGRQKISVKNDSFTVHPQWNSTLYFNDIGLIKLLIDARIGPHIQIISLPFESDAGETFEGVTAVASGWGRVSDDSAVSSKVLRYVNLEVTNNKLCNMVYLVVQPSNICTFDGTAYRNPCQGDSGGPLVYHSNRNGRKILIGLTSYGSHAGCERALPAVFTRITSYFGWIQQVSGIS